MAKYIVETDGGKYQIETEDTAPEVEATPGQSLLSKVGQFAGEAAGSILPGFGRQIGGYLGKTIAENPRKSAELAVNVGLPLAASAGLAATGVGIPAAIGTMGLVGAGLEGYKQAGRSIIGAPPVEGKQGILEQLKQMGMAGVKEAGYQAGGEVAAKVIPPLIKGAAKSGSKLSELLTGTKAGDFQRVAANPETFGGYLVPEKLGGAPSAKTAGKALGEAEKAAGFIRSPLEEAVNAGGGVYKYTHKGAKSSIVGFEDPLTKSNVDLPLDSVTPQNVKKAIEESRNAYGIKTKPEPIGKQNPFESNQGIVQHFYDKTAKGETLSPPETLEAYRAASDYLKTVSRKDRRYADMVKFEKSLQDNLKSLSKDYQKASAVFAKAATGRSVTNVLPRTQTGKVSQGRVGFNALLTGGGLFTGGLPGAAAAFAASSPIVHGAGYAAAGAASKALQNPFLRRFAASQLPKPNDKKK